MDVNAVAGMAVSMKQTQFRQEVGTAVLKMGMDQGRQAGEMINQVLQASTKAMRAAQPHLGSNIDLYA